MHNEVHKEMINAIKEDTKQHKERKVTDVYDNESEGQTEKMRI